MKRLLQRFAPLFFDYDDTFGIDVCRIALGHLIF